MNAIKKCRLFFWLSVLFLTLMSGTFLIMQYAVDKGGELMIVFVGIAFYVFLIAGYVLVAVANHMRKKIKTEKSRRKTNNDRMGVITFFANIPAKIFDVIMVVALIGFVIINFTSHKDDYITFVLLSILVLSVNMHSLFNGRIFRVINNQGDKEK